METPDMGIETTTSMSTIYSFWLNQIVKSHRDEKLGVTETPIRNLSVDGAPGFFFSSEVERFFSNFP